LNRFPIHGWLSFEKKKKFPFSFAPTVFAALFFFNSSCHAGLKVDEMMIIFSGDGRGGQVLLAQSRPAMPNYSNEKVDTIVVTIR
jgi:P pilus assembly chaperone PapD